MPTQKQLDKAREFLLELRKEHGDYQIGAMVYAESGYLPSLAMISRVANEKQRMSQDFCLALLGLKKVYK